jgi:hypothetical protein
MTLKELHHFIFTELGVDPKLLHQSKTRTDNEVVKYARMIFCTIAKERGHKAVEIGDYILREYSIVNYDIRELNKVLWRSDFLSKSICESYNKVVALLRETKL